jgi:hypothetical protein
VLVFAVTLSSPHAVSAQDKPAIAEITPLRVQVVISRFQGDKKISSLPYTLSVNATTTNESRLFGRANLRMGSKIPITMMAPPTVDGKPVSGMMTTGPIQYQDVGTNIDCGVSGTGDGRFRLDITVDDSSVYPDDRPPEGGAKGSPSFRSFRATDSMILKDGGTAQFTTATDKVNGEIVKVDVTLTVMK